MASKSTPSKQELRELGELLTKIQKSLYEKDQVVKCHCCETPLDHFRDGITTEGSRCNNCYWEDEARTEDEFDAIIEPDYRVNVRKH